MSFKRGENPDTFNLFTQQNLRCQQAAALLLGVSKDEELFSVTLSLNQIVVPNLQPRRYFNEEKLDQLAESIKKHGILENLLVRPSSKRPRIYELIVGERRYRAAQRAGLSDVPVTIQEFSDEEALELALIENLQREDLNNLEETEAILQLLAQRLEREPNDLYRYLTNLLKRQQRQASSSDNFMEPEDSELSNNVMGQKELTIIQQLFNQLGTMSWESFVSNRLPLLKLPEEILEALREGHIEYTKAKAIAKIKNKEQRKQLLTLAIEEHLSTRSIRQEVKKIENSDSSEETPLVEPSQRMEQVTKRIKKEKPWDQAPEKWKKIENYLQAIEELLESEEKTDSLS